MSQTVLTASWAAAPDAAGSGVPAGGAWAARIPPLAPGVFRVRPLLFEATASYLQRLAGAYRLTLPQLLDGSGITVHGHGTSPAAGLCLTPGAAHRIAVLGRIPLAHLTRALPHLTHHRRSGPGPAAAYWKPLEAEHQPVAACALCTWHHSRGVTGMAWVHRPWHRLVCPRHQQAAPGPRLTSTLHTWAVPELITAHHAHQRLKRHPQAASAWMTARAVTTRWYDHQQHLTGRWQHRLGRLVAGNTHLGRAGTASAVLLARDLVTYPETVALARTLATLPHTRRTRTGDLLGVIAHRLKLDTLTPTTSDPLTVYLTHARP
ncbi:TniQ family protein [Streptomyces sp. NBC_00984]|uniref:hypothetical protein n=1 Tax=Streptomyces sp. NBC_00984 TaxID=2903700 RepID=UPI003866F49D|nr:TniQ family protein [Streptomyces sp. NBC_00984]